MTGAGSRRPRDAGPGTGPGTGPGAGVLAAVAGLVLAGHGLYQLVPGIDSAGGQLAQTLIRAAVCALGFIVLAARWEHTVRAVVRDPLPLLVIASALATTAWAADRAATAQAGLILLLAWVFGAALAIRYGAPDLARMAALASLVLVLSAVSGQLAGGGPVAGVQVPAGELGVALVACLWAAGSDPAWRSGWLVCAVVCAVLGLASADPAVAGAVVGAGAGWGLARLLRAGAPGLLGMAWLAVAAVAGLTVFALFVAPGLALWLDRTAAELGLPAGAGRGLSWLVGTGFGDPRNGLVSAFVVGAGLWGTGLALLAVAGALLRAALRPDPSGSGWALPVGGLAGVCWAAATAVPAGGLAVILLSAAAVAVTLQPVRSAARPLRRRPLLTPDRPGRATRADAEPLAGRGGRPPARGGPVRPRPDRA